MIANNYFTDDEDLKLFFEHLIDWSSIVKATEGEEFFDHEHYKKTADPRFEMAPSNVQEAIELYRSSLESLGEFFGKEVSQLSQTMDKKHLRYENGKVIFPEETVFVYEKFRETGLMSYSISREAGGLALPATVGAFFVMIMARGDVSFCMTVTLLNLAQIVARFGSKEQIEEFAAKAALGKTLFAMALTEPDFGSDLNNVRTTATKIEDGSYRINGTKRFISQGCGLGPYPSSLLTLARTGKQNGGARGLSVFLVKSSDVTVAGIETKMGIHASPTCEIVYDNSYAELLGEEGLGLTRYTAGMTNFMRLGSAAGGPGGGAGGFYESKKYAEERIQFGKPIAEIPAVSEMLHKIQREVNAMRLLTFETARVVDMYQHHQIRMEKANKEDREIRKEERVKTWGNLASILTPIAKYYCSEEAHKCANLAIQIHGGAGYTEDYDVSRMFRDSRINTIYEGTSQIHVRIATGAIVAGMTADGNFRKYLETIQKEVKEPSSFLLEQWNLLESAIKIFKSIEREETKERVAENLMVLASRYLCGLLYERAILKLKEQEHESLHRWTDDCRAYLIDSTAIAKSCIYRIENAE
ncbi:acyl-CoA dehydrogenase family protein [Leptospira stimsonii]|uniref:Acyl-CoA dehydrogenase n=1 Tax=Leptospira stimsonii TaxID=2202203 RepID=A0A4R9L3B7_9LEPT|nr:acyl-CoA dehydrogenase family protein [Leptospira stimsonii]RHX88815.1 acyl-CoA dehydrogenase [Leptospira stimsonii]TGK17757.1 acyl-CoA dehydrogenase [Leptospira stimsonii]TGM12600.1 acyl-CoA dehydrogenase [Leptospira stimsonii]